MGFSEHEQKCDEEHEFESPVEFLLGWRKRLLVGKDRQITVISKEDLDLRHSGNMEKR